MSNISMMLADLKAIGYVPAYTYDEYIVDCYNQLIARQYEYTARQDYVTIVLHPANKILKEQYMWRAK